MTFSIVVYDEKLNRLYHLLLCYQISYVGHRPSKHLRAKLYSLLAGRDANKLVLDASLLELETDSLLIYVAIVNVEDQSVLLNFSLTIYLNLLSLLCIKINVLHASYGSIISCLLQTCQTVVKKLRTIELVLIGMLRSQSKQSLHLAVLIAYKAFIGCCSDLSLSRFILKERDYPMIRHSPPICLHEAPSEVICSLDPW